MPLEPAASSREASPNSPPLVTEATWQRCGASVTGPGHHDKGLPNQDAWASFEGEFGTGIVVCDGLGSKPHSEAGSRLACRAVVRALQIWREEPSAADLELIRLIHALWNISVAKYEARQAATTCLFAVALRPAEILLGQLGDGMILLQSPRQGIRRITPPRDGFLNETTGLGIAKSADDWLIERLPAEEDMLIMLATDGVADDLIPDALDNWLTYWREQLYEATPRQRVARIRRDLIGWPRPMHSDDKTIAFLWTANA